MAEPISKPAGHFFVKATYHFAHNRQFETPLSVPLRGIGNKLQAEQRPGTRIGLLRGPHTELGLALALEQGHRPAQSRWLGFDLCGENDIDKIKRLFNELMLHSVVFSFD